MRIWLPILGALLLKILSSRTKNCGNFGSLIEMGWCHYARTMCSTFQVYACFDFGWDGWIYQFL